MRQKSCLFREALRSFRLCILIITGDVTLLSRHFLDVYKILRRPAITVMAEVDVNDDAGVYMQQIVSRNIVGEPVGNASVIADDDLILDDQFHNGELVNGFICHNKGRRSRLLQQI